MNVAQKISTALMQSWRAHDVSERISAKLPDAPVLGILSAVLLVGCPQMLYSTGFIENFEPFEGNYENAQSIGSLSHWTLSTGGDARISSEEFVSALQSLKLQSGDPETIAVRSVAAGEWDSEPVAFWDVYILPVADATSQPENILDMDGALIAFIKDGVHGRFGGFDSDGSGGGVGVFSNYLFPVNAYNQSTEWIRLSFRHDYSSGTWDVFIDGDLAMVDLGLESPPPLPTGVEFTGHISENIYVDDLILSYANPLFPDTSRDGLPDDWLVLHGLSPLTNQRDLDADSDGLPNIQEFLLGKLPGVPDVSDASSTFFYADSSTGDDAFDGLAAVPVSASTGPKATISSALSTVSHGDTLLLLTGDAIYSESVLALDGKSIRIKPVGNPSIQ